jgi:ketopantoate hydroxymethyltransferase
MKNRGQRIVILTAYRATMAKSLDKAGVEVLLVDDRLAQVILALDTTGPSRSTRSFITRGRPAIARIDDVQEY